MRLDEFKLDTKRTFETVRDAKAYVSAQIETNQNKMRQLEEHGVTMGKANAAQARCLLIWQNITEWMKTASKADKDQFEQDLQLREMKQIADENQRLNQTMNLDLILINKTEVLLSSSYDCISPAGFHPDNQVCCLQQVGF